MNNNAFLIERHRHHPVGSDGQHRHRGQAMKPLFLVAIFASSLGMLPARAGEGNGEPFPNSAGNLTSQAIRVAPWLADTGSSAYPDVAGGPGFNLPQLVGDVLPTNGSEGAVQTAGSLPVHSEEGTVAYAQEKSIYDWMVNHTRGNAPAYVFLTPRPQQ